MSKIIKNKIKQINKMKKQDMLGAGLVVVGVALLSGSQFAGMLFIGFGLGYNLRPIIQKLFEKK